MIPTLLRIEDVAERTGIPLETLRYWRKVRKGGPPFTKIGRRLVLRESDLEEWIAEHFPDAG